MTREDAPVFVREIIKTSGDMWMKGWAEANGGNISLRLNPEKTGDLSAFSPKTGWIPLEKALPGVAGEKFLVSGTGKFLRNIPLFPEKNVGVIELDDAGAAYRQLWGFEPDARPTSELEAHLRSHEVIKAASGNVRRAVIHTHAPHLIALTYALELDTPRLTKLLWQSHAECVVGFPEGVEFIPWMMAGSPEIAAATADALLRRNLAVWQFHGVFATGRNLDAAFGLIDMADKAAQIYLMARSAGRVACTLSTGQVARIAANFKVTADPEGLAADTAAYFA